MSQVQLLGLGQRGSSLTDEPEGWPEPASHTFLAFAKTQGSPSLQLLIQDAWYCPRFCISQQLWAMLMLPVHGPHAE